MWEVSTSSVYQENGVAAPTLVNRTARKMGTGADSITEHSDATGQTVVSTSNVDRGTGTTTVTSDSSVSTLDAVSVYRYGRLVSQSSFTVATPATYGYDAFGRVESVTDPRTGAATTRTYSPSGQLLSETTPGPNGPITTGYGYYPADHASAGRLHWKADGRGIRTYYAYTATGQVSHQWGGGAYPLRYVYSPYGEMAELHTYQEGRASLWTGPSVPGAFDQFDAAVTSWNYDPASGVLMNKRDAAGLGAAYTHHDSGLVHTRTWARGVVTTYGYHPSGELHTTSYSDGTPGSTRTYRRDGSIATLADAAGTSTFAHANPGGRASGETVTGGILDGLSVAYPEIAGGRRSGFTANFGGTSVANISYGYGTTGRLQTAAGLGLTTTYGYKPDSDLIGSTVTAASGGTVLSGTRAYDSAGRLDFIGYTKGDSSTATSHDYTYDAAHRRTAVLREDGSYWSYGYNDRGEVTSSGKYLADGSPLAGWQQDFGYDGIGNREWTDQGGDATRSNLRRTSYTADETNQYASITNPGAFHVVGKADADTAVLVDGQAVTKQGTYWNHEVTGIENSFGAAYQNLSIEATQTGGAADGSDLEALLIADKYVPPLQETPVHDEDGNLKSDGRWLYTWSGENRLIGVETNPGAVANGVPKQRFAYDYDSRGRRIRQRIELWSMDDGAYLPPVEVRYVYDQWNVVAVVDANGNPVQQYLWGTDLSGTMQGAGGVGGLLGASDAVTGRTWAYVYDGNGNVSAVVDAADGSAAFYDYDAFGRTVGQWGDRELAELNAYRFSTKPVDGTGLYYYGFRYYRPTEGRWASRDPIGENGGVNLYGFVGNDPIGKTDLLGMITQIQGNYFGLISNQISDQEEFYRAIGMTDAVDRIFSRGIPPIVVEDLGPNRLGSYDENKGVITINLSNSFFNESTFLHEMFHFYDTSLSHGGREDEGVAYMVQHYYNMGKEWGRGMQRQLDRFMRGEDCEWLEERLNIYWPPFWDSTPSPEVVTGQYNAWLFRMSFTADSSDVDRTERLLNTRLSCQEIADWVNSIIEPHCPCFRLACERGAPITHTLPVRDILPNQTLQDFR